MPRFTVGLIGFDVHTLLFASLAIICGYQSIVFAIFTKVIAINDGLLPVDGRIRHLFQLVTLERGLLVGAAGLLAGTSSSWGPCCNGGRWVSARSTSGTQCDGPFPG